MFFLLRPVGRRDLSAGPEQKKKHHPGCFCFAPTPPIGRGRRSAIGSRRGAGAKKKNTLGGNFSFCSGPADRSRRPGGVVFFFCCGPARTGVVFYFWLRPRPDGHSLTVGWGDPFGKARVDFFCCGPAEPGEPITKNVWRTRLGLKRPGGATAKINTTSRQHHQLHN